MKRIVTAFFVICSLVHPRLDSRASKYVMMVDRPGDDIAGSTTSVGLPNEKIKYAQVSDGLKLEYVETGDSTGTPVIFLHGYSDSWTSYQLVLPHLPSSIHGYSISQRGHGNSGKPLRNYHAKDFAGDVADFMKLMKIPSAIIVGHSMGGTVAQRFAIDYPEKTRGLVLVSSFASFRNNAGVDGLRQYINQMNAVDTGFVTDFQKSTIVKPVSPDYFNTVVSESLKLPVHVWKGVANDLISTDILPGLNGISIPTLIIWGNKDAFCSLDDQKTLVQAIKGSELRQYEDVGHAVHWEEPGRFAADLEKFVNAIR